MFFFRLFHLNKNSGEPFYSMIYTGHLVFDAYVGYDLGRWSVETPRVTMLYYDDRNAENAYPVEDAAEPNGENAYADAVEPEPNGENAYVDAVEPEPNGGNAFVVW